jgi:hypothetical protein
VRQTFTGFDDAHVSDVLLVATELVSTAYDHDRRPHQIRLSHRSKPCRAGIEIVYNAPGPPKPWSSHGLGLAIIRHVTTTWGTDDLPGGVKTVWAEIPCAGSDLSPCVKTVGQLRG